MTRSTCLVVAALVASALTSCDRADDVLWELHTPRPFMLAGDSQMYGPAIVGDLAIYCGGYFWNDDARIAAVRVHDGKEVWSHRLGSCKSEPVIADTIAIAFGRDPARKTLLKAFHARSGGVLWQLGVGDGTVYSRPYVRGEWLHLHDNDTLLSVMARTGEAERVDIPGCGRNTRNKAWLARHGDAMLLGCGRSVYELDGPRLRHPPRLRLEERVDFHATVHGDVLYAAFHEDATGDSVTLAAFDLRDGHLLWRRRWRTVLHAPVYAGEGIYINVIAPWSLVALEARTGNIRWSNPVHSFHPPRVADGHLYSTDRQSVVEIDRRTAGVIRRFRSSAEVTTTPVLVDGVLLYGNLNGVLYGVRAPVEQHP